MSNTVGEDELKEEIKLFLQDAMGDFPTEHLLEYHADNFQTLITKKQIELLEHLMTSDPKWTYDAAKDILIELKSGAITERKEEL